VEGGKALKRKLLLYFCLAILGFTLGVFIFDFFNPTVLEGLKEYSVEEYNRAFVGDTKTCSEFKRTLTGEWLCVDDGIVYSSVFNPNLKGEGKELESAKNKGVLQPKHVFKDGEWRNKVPAMRDVSITNSEEIWDGGWLHVDNEGTVWTRSSERDGNEAWFGRIKVFEDGVVKTPKEAKSLVGKSVLQPEQYAAGEGWGTITHLDYNHTSVSVELQITDSDHLNKDKTFYVDDFAYDTVNHKNLEDTTIFHLNWEDGIVRHNITFNPSFTYTNSLDNGTFEDNMLNSEDAISMNNRGKSTSTCAFRYATYGYNYQSLNLFNLREAIGSGMTIDNVTAHFTNTENSAYVNITFAETLGMWEEGIYTGSDPGNSSWDYPNNTADIANPIWTTDDGYDGELKNDYKGETLALYYGPSGTTTPHFDADLTSTTASKASVQAKYDSTEDDGGNITFNGNITDDNSENMKICWCTDDHATIGNRPMYYVEWTAPNTPPTCEEADVNITVLEDSPAWTLDGNMSVAVNISCSDVDGDPLTYTITDGTETGTYGTFTNDNNDDLVYTPAANASGGTDVVTIEVSDGEATTDIHAQVTVNAVEDHPWWDDIVNTTEIEIGLGYQALGVNASFYFRDVESDQTPDNITITVNESLADCKMDTVSDFNILCDPGTLSYNLIAVTLVGDEGGDSITNNFEFRASNLSVWWDYIGNNTALDINVTLGKQPVINNLSQYFRGYFTDQSPDNISITTNESNIACSTEANLSMFCTPQCYAGDYIMMANGTSSYNKHALESFEGFVKNDAPPIPNVHSPDNETATDNETVYLSASGGLDPEGGTVYYQYYGDTTNPPTTLVDNTTLTTIAWNLTTIGAYWWQVRACDSCGVCSAYNSTRYLDVDFDNLHWIDENVTLNQTSTGSYDYEVNVTYNDNRFSDVTASVNISNQTYTLSEEKINSSVSRFYRSISTLETWELLSVPFSWNFSFQYANDTSQYHYNSSFGGSIDVNKANFTYCQDDIDTVYLNFSFRDETNSSVLKANIPSSSFTYSIDSSQGITKSISYSSVDNNRSYGFCFYPQIEDVYTDIDFNYRAPGYTQRKYQTDATHLPNATTNTILYLIPSSEASSTTFQVVNEADQTISEVYVTSSKLIGSTWTVIESKYTDDAGGATFSVDTDATYRFAFTKGGYEGETLTLVPSQSSYTVTLVSSAADPTENYNLGMNYVIMPDNDTLTNQTVYNFSFVITSGYYILGRSGFVLTNYAGEVLGSDSCTESLGCCSSAEVSTGVNNSKVYMQYYWLTNETYSNGTRTWSVANIYPGRSSLVKFKDDFKKLAATFDGGEDSTGFQFTKALIAFFIIFMMTASVSYLSGIYSQVSITGVAFATTVFLDVVGFIPALGSISPHFISAAAGLMFGAALINEYWR